MTVSALKRQRKEDSNCKVTPLCRDLRPAWATIPYLEWGEVLGRLVYLKSRGKVPQKGETIQISITCIWRTEIQDQPGLQGKIKTKLYNVVRICVKVKK